MSSRSSSTLIYVSGPAICVRTGASGREGLGFCCDGQPLKEKSKTLFCLDHELHVLDEKRITVEGEGKIDVDYIAEARAT